MAEDYEETRLADDIRPAIVRWIGLPLYTAVPLIMAAPIIINTMSSWRARLVALAILTVAAIFFGLVLRHDYNMLRILWRWFLTKFMSFDARKWKGATTDPFPYRASKAPHGIYDE